jgi:hypothetical protein
MGSFGAKVLALVKCLLALKSGHDITTKRIIEKKLHIQETSIEMELDEDKASNNITESSSNDDMMITTKGHTIKSLVFSQWEEALTITEAALTRNGIRSIRFNTSASSGEILKKFASPQENISVLLLSFRAGAEGLNLTCANHVFFLDPLIQPDLEQQAIGRIYRIGQTRPSFVHRILVKSSVEETVSALSKARLARKSHEVIRRNQHAISQEDIDEVMAVPTLDSIDTILNRIASQPRLMDISAAVPVHQNRLAIRSKEVEVTRGDVLKLFELQQKFADDIKLMGQTSSLSSSSSFASSSSSSSSSNAIEKLPLVDESILITDDTKKKEEKETIQTAAKNFKYWSTFVSINGKRKIRLAHLEELTSIHGQQEIKDEEKEQLFGRTVHKEIAKVFKQQI